MIPARRVETFTHESNGGAVASVTLVVTGRGAAQIARIHLRPGASWSTGALRVHELPSGALSVEVAGSAELAALLGALGGIVAKHAEAR